METTYSAKARYLRIAPRKLRRVAPLVRGKTLEDAISILKFMPKKASRLIETALRSAQGNAKDRSKGEVEGLIVTSVRVDNGPMLKNAKRWHPKAMGKVGRIHPRTSHLEVVITGEAKEAAAGQGKTVDKKNPKETVARVSSPEKTAKAVKAGAKKRTDEKRSGK